MNIVITTMDDPLVTNDLLIHFIKNTNHKVTHILVSKPNQFNSITKDSNNIDFEYPLTLFVIAGLIPTSKKLFKLLKYRLSDLYPNLFFNSSSTIKSICEEKSISYSYCSSVNNAESLSLIKKAKPDLIINQSQEIVSSSFVKLAKIGVVNRHNSILPQYRGRLAPFWALKNKEEFTAVSIHLIGEKIDRGPLIYQKRIKINENETFESLTNKCYYYSRHALLLAVDLLSTIPVAKFPIPKGKGSYFSFPSLREAINFRLGK